MTLDEAIRHCEEVAWENDKKAMCIEEAYQTTEQQNCEQCAADHRQLAKWLTELKEAKRLLKAAVEDIGHCMHSYDPCEVCSLLGEDGECPATDDDDCKEKYKWRYEDEAKKLIGGE
jgi:hypothetical protein